MYSSRTCELHIEQGNSPSRNPAILRIKDQERLNSASLLGSSQIVGLVPKRPGNELNFWDASKEKEVASVKIDNPILGFELSTTFAVIASYSTFNLYRHQPKLERLRVYDTAPNPLGLARLGKHTAVFPGRRHGQIQMLDLQKFSTDIVPAHTSRLVALDVSQDGRYVASASENVGFYGL